MAFTRLSVMNNLIELFNIVDFLNPGFFGQRKNFIQIYEKPISATDNEEATNEELKLGRTLKYEL